MSHATTGDKFDAMDLSPVRLDQPRAAISAAVCEIAQLFAHRGWSLAGGGHFSVALRREPARLLITPDGIDKSTLAPDDLTVLEHEQIDTAWPEARLHEQLVRHAGAGAVIHTQSPAALALSEAYASQGGFTLDGYDLLRQVHGSRTADAHHVPIIDYAPHSPTIGRQLVALLTDARHPARYAILLRRCGLVTWGDDLDQARRHAELFETLFATLINRLSLTGRH